MSFFERGVDVPEPHEERQPYTRQPSWRGPSEDEVGRPLATSFVLARSASAAVVVRAIRVHRDGCLFDLAWVIRRTTEDTAQWRAVGDIAHDHRHSGRPGEDALLFGVEFSDGSAARTTDVLDRRDPGSGPHLVRSGGSGSGGGSERIHGEMQLWLSPLPPAGRLEVVCAWPRFGLAESRHAVEGAAVREAAAEADLIWADDADLSTAEQ